MLRKAPAPVCSRRLHQRVTEEELLAKGHSKSGHQTSIHCTRTRRRENRPAMKRLTPLIVAVALIFLASYAVPLKAQQYDRYCNARYGFCVSYPSNFRMEPPPENDDGRRFDGPNGLIMTASGINNVLERTVQTEMSSQGDSFDTITYRAKGRNWFVLSGHKGANIVYIKTFVGSGSMNHLVFEYPASLSAKYAGIVAKVARSFKPGNLGAVH